MLRVVGESADEGVVEEGVWVGNLVEHVDGEGEEVGEGVGGDELGSEEGVGVEVGADELGVDLFEVGRVGAGGEVGEVALEEAAVGGPFWGADWEGHWLGDWRERTRQRS